MSATPSPPTDQRQSRAVVTRGPEESDRAADADPDRWWTLLAVCLGTFMLLLDLTIVNVALPDIQAALSASFTSLQWVVDVYALTLAALLLTAGSLADIYGRRRLYVVGLALFTAASALCGAAGDTVVLQLARGLQGVGGAVIFATSLGPVGRRVPRPRPRDRLRRVGSGHRPGGRRRASASCNSRASVSASAGTLSTRQPAPR